MLVFGGMIAAVVALFAATAGGSYAMTLENNDPFCASCHTQPEETYYQQSLDPNAPNLAAFHAQKQVCCIDCHSGGGAFGRISGLTQGTQDLIAFYSGHYNSPAVTQSPLGDDSCVKCHIDATTRGDFSNHFHLLLSRWQSVDPNAGRCVDCHTAHPGGDPAQQYLSQQKVEQVCNQCHAVLRGD